ncbi:LPXTG cell wall anchor domain-containing protein [Streptomyces sp. NBC_00576]|uniref:LPXTG cell wall anchor domain-containing protein n=1 Tax=Streptomyces sp. NBC_00576 TaxID=2903665 RepID=UPI002E80BCC8|nr:LPXTG cell wall anchor domain-containing protein [Streptomyces sp. NBC_00576]WUB71871.1 LPXTG cell wall anchor domain-containing protein [Streptomyces sp. NBC_00576]
MRTLIRAGALTAGVSAALFLAPAAHALPFATVSGDNGTVKIHDATTGEELHQNEPHVCTFYLDAFGFDAVQEVDWHIESWAPTAAVKGTTVKSGEITLDAEGHGRTDDLSLPDGHYKLFWNFEGENGAAKHKVFWTDCTDSGGTDGGGATPSSSPSSSSSSSSPSPSASSTDPDGATASPSASEAGSGTTADPSASPSAQGGGTGDLAETGSSAPAGLLSAAALALVGTGGYLMLRRRRAAGN